MSVKISELPECTQTNDQCCVPIVSEGTTKRITYGTLYSLLKGKYDEVYQPKGDYRTKAENDELYQPKGNYYTKTEVNNLFNSIVDGNEVSY